MPAACPSKIQFGNALPNNSCRAIAPVARQGLSCDPSTPVAMGSSDALRAQHQSMRMTPVVAAQQFFSAIAASPRASYSYHQVLISPGSACVVSPGVWRTPVVPIGTAILAPAGTSAGAPQHVEPQLGQKMRGLIREVGSTLLAGSRSVLRRTGVSPKRQLRAGL